MRGCARSRQKTDRALWGRQLARRALAAGAFVAAAGSGEASAQRSAVPQGGPIGAVASLDAGAHWFPSLPSFQLARPADETFDGRLPDKGGKLGAGGLGATTVYTGFALAGVVSDRYLLPLLSLDVGHAVGRSDRVFGSVDGGIAELRPWTLWHIGVTALGFGARWKHRRWMLEAQLLPGISVMVAQASIAEGATSYDLSAVAVSPLLRATIAGCRRLDPVERVCLFVGPSVYEMGFLNGGVAGLRWELGS